jgi:hypothetical protein
MRFAAAIVFLLTLCPCLTNAGSKKETAGIAQPSQASASQTDVQALRNDLQRMKALVQQMELNLAFVDTTDSPLKHQFRLEIDMWKTVIGEMERKLDSSGAR